MLPVSSLEKIKDSKKIRWKETGGIILTEQPQAL